MSRTFFADEPAIDRTIAENRGNLHRLHPETRKGLEISLIGLGVKIEQSDKLLPLTLPEKIRVLVALLEEGGCLGDSRKESRDDLPPYIQETCLAWRVVVPAQSVPNRTPRPAFSFWLRPATKTLGQLCVMEGNGSDLENPFNYARASTYTVLQSLLHFSRQQRRAGVLMDVVAKVEHPNPHANVDETHPPSLINEYFSAKNYSYDFFKDPEQVLSEWGCDVSAPTNVRILYRVREYGPEAATDWKLVSTFGYALCVESAA